MLKLFISGLKRNVSYCEMKGEKTIYILVNVHPCVAGHFSIRTFGVRPARLHKVELNAHCCTHVFLQVC